MSEWRRKVFVYVERVRWGVEEGMRLWCACVSDGLGVILKRQVCVLYVERKCVCVFRERWGI